MLHISRYKCHIDAHSRCRWCPGAHLRGLLSFSNITISLALPHEKNKPIPGLMLAQIQAAMWRHSATMSQFSVPGMNWRQPSRRYYQEQILHAAVLRHVYLYSSTLIPARISNLMASKVWCAITYQFPNFNGCAVEVWKWISNCIPHFGI